MAAEQAVRRIVTIGVVCVWLAMLAALVRRTWLPAPISTVPLELSLAGGAEEEEDWMGVYYDEHKIGYTHQRLTRDGDGFVFSQSSLLRVKVLDVPQTVRTQARGRTGPDLALRQVEFDLTSGAGKLQASGTVVGSSLRLAVRTGDDLTERTLALSEPLYLASLLRGAVGLGRLEAGRRVEALVFDPTALGNARMTMTVEAQEPVPEMPGALGWRVREEFRGLQTTAWLDAEGAVLREEGPMGLKLVRETREQAVSEGWSEDTLLDIVAHAAVPVAQPIDNPRQRSTLRLRLSGIPAERVPSDAQQAWDGSVLQITRPDLRTVESYPLPYLGTEHANSLAPTALLQSDHPRLQQLAGEIVGDGTDALIATRRLNDWVYANLRKVPTMSIPNALQVLEMGEGDCNEHAVLFTALARAAGLPARVVAGTVYLDGAFMYHAWSEVWLGRWVSVDPVMQQLPADATHIKLVAGDAEVQVEMVDLIGRLQVEVVPDRDPEAS